MTGWIYCNYFYAKHFAFFDLILYEKINFAYGEKDFKGVNDFVINVKE